MLVTKALVLSRSDWRDYDRMVTLLTPEYGRIDAVARGCRKPKSPLLNAAERFSAGEYTLAESKGRFTITGAEVNESFYPLRQDFDRLTAGAYLLHLLLQAAMPGQPQEALFLTSLKALAYLSYGELPIHLVVAAFELHYLNLTGQSPRMDSCLVCGREFLEEDARFDVRAGGAVCLSCPSVGGRLTHGARRILLRVPATRFEVIGKLANHPNLDEAAAHARRFMMERLDKPPRVWPPTQDVSKN